MEYNEIVKEIINYNDERYNISKLAEELFELGEVCMKMLNKKPDKKPPIEKLIEELGDTILRCKVLSTQLNITKEVNTRAIAKAEQLYAYIEQGRYKGGI